MEARTKGQKASNFFITRERCIGLARIAFGVAWAVAAWLKWQPAFINGFADTIKGAIDGQPHIVQVWLSFWLTIINVNPTLFAVMEATIETLLAVCFLLGLFTDVACIIGMLLALGIWSIPEAFGGPYIAGQSTDIGTAFPYIILCALLLCVHAGSYYGVDNLLASRLKRPLGMTVESEKVHKVAEEEKVPAFFGEHKMHHRR
jgi:thiosulfate dehydrogenase [quinone] large subunit